MAGAFILQWPVIRLTAVNKRPGRYLGVGAHGNRAMVGTRSCRSGPERQRLQCRRRIFADGSQLFLVNHYDPSSNASRTQGIAVSRNNGNGWSNPENITIPYFQNKSDILAGFISPDQSVFVYSAETYGTRGVEDIYVTLRGADGKWSEPRNLGSTINTQLQELSPSLSADGKALYFASNGRKGYSSFDIFSSSRLDDTWTAWTTPVNLGSPFNTEGRRLAGRSNSAKLRQVRIFHLHQHTQQRRLRQHRTFHFQRSQPQG